VRHTTAHVNTRSRCFTSVSSRPAVSCQTGSPGGSRSNQTGYNLPNRRLVADSGMIAGNFHPTERYEPCSPDYSNVKIAAALTATVRVPEASRRNISCRFSFFARCVAAIAPAGHCRTGLSRFKSATYESATCKSATSPTARLSRDDLQLPDSWVVASGNTYRYTEEGSPADR